MGIDPDLNDKDVFIQNHESTITFGAMIRSPQLYPAPKLKYATIRDFALLESNATGLFSSKMIELKVEKIPHPNAIMPAP